MSNQNNSIVVTGTISEGLTLNHEIMGERFYTSVLDVKRKSGVVDHLPITIPGKIVQNADALSSGFVTIEGQIRTYNKRVNDANRLVVTIFASSITPAASSDDTVNLVSVRGVLCKVPNYRSTPFGREICDMMIAINRAYGKSDYIPCIAWGRNAKCAQGFHVGDIINISGRLQSREYQKIVDDAYVVHRTAIEISVFTLENDSILPTVE